MSVRLFILAAICLAICGGAYWAKERGMPADSALPEMKAQDLPTTLGEWKGEDVTLDPDVFRRLGAETTVDRNYSDGHGGVASVHVAVFQNPRRIIGLPHPPEVCYPAAGWSLGEPKYVSPDSGGATENEAEFLPIQRREEKSYVLCWYQMDGSTFYRKGRQKSLALALRGRPAWPPLVKVMLQTTAASPDDAEKTLKSIAGEVYKWSRGFH